MAASSHPPGFVLETERLVLRELEPGDLDDLAQLYADPEVRRFFPEGTLSREETERELLHLTGHYARHGFGLWATVLKDTGRFVGRSGLLPWTIEGRPEVEVAYSLARDVWGRGLATEAARAIRDHGFRRLGLRRLICLVDEGNLASRRVAEKLGMELEGVVDDGLGPALLYALSREEPAPR